MYASNENFQKPPVVTGIPVNQYHNETPHHPLQDHSGPWSSRLCDCCSDCGSCCLTCWCPCITFGRIAEIVDKGTTSCAASGAIYALLAWFTGCSCIYSCLYRSKMRHQHRLDEKPCNDCLVHCCCESCAHVKSTGSFKTVDLTCPLAGSVIWRDKIVALQWLQRHRHLKEA